MVDLKSLDYEKLCEYMESAGEPPYRADQVFSWMHEKLVLRFDEMTNIPAKLRAHLESECTFTALKCEEHLKSKRDGTEKFLFSLGDGNLVESVLMRYKFGNSVCISTQAGCRMGCVFCASGIGGLVRNLTPSEMLEEVYSIRRVTGERVSHVVLMGTGEPLDNLENVFRFLELITHEKGQNISRRNITVSTCGIVPGIRQLADADTGVTLAVSLHAAEQKKRERIMPSARAYRIDDILSACDYFFRKTGRRVTFEYSLMGGLNDSHEDAEKLAALLAGKGAHVNLIPVNPVKETGCRKPGGKAVAEFKQILEARGINATVRRSLGGDIDGACGQLRRRNIIKESWKSTPKNHFSG